MIARIKNVLYAYDIVNPWQTAKFDFETGEYIRTNQFHVDDAPDVEEALKLIQCFHRAKTGKELSDIDKEKIARVLTDQNCSLENRDSPFNYCMLEQTLGFFDLKELPRYINRDLILDELKGLISNTEGREKKFLYVHANGRVSLRASTRTTAVAKLLLAKSDSCLDGWEESFSFFDKFMWSALTVLIEDAEMVQVFKRSSFEKQVEILSDLFFDEDDDDHLYEL